MSEISREHFEANNRTELGSLEDINNFIDLNLKLVEFAESEDGLEDDPKVNNKIDTFLANYQLTNEFQSEDEEEGIGSVNLESRWENFDKDFRNFLQHKLFLFGLGNDEEIQYFIKEYFSDEIAAKFKTDTDYKGDGDVSVEGHIYYDGKPIILYSAEMKTGNGEYMLPLVQSKLLFSKLAIESGVKEINE